MYLKNMNNCLINKVNSMSGYQIDMWMLPVKTAFHSPVKYVASTTSICKFYASAYCHNWCNCLNW